MLIPDERKNDRGQYNMYCVSVEQKCNLKANLHVFFIILLTSVHHGGGDMNVFSIRSYEEIQQGVLKAGSDER